MNRVLITVTVAWWNCQDDQEVKRPQYSPQFTQRFDQNEDNKKLVIQNMYMDKDHILILDVSGLLDDCEYSKTRDTFEIWTLVCSYTVRTY